MSTSPSALNIAVIYNPPKRSTKKEPNMFLSEKHAPEIAKAITDSLQHYGYQASMVAVSQKNLDALEHQHADLFFNVCDGDGIWPKVLNQLEKHHKLFTGSNLYAMTLTVDKVATKRIFEKVGVPTPKWQVFHSAQDPLDSSLHFPLIVKPIQEDCSVGISPASVVHTDEELRARVQSLCAIYTSGALVEEFILGIELQCTVVGNGKSAIMLPPAQLSLQNGTIDDSFVYDYDAKWVHDSPRYGLFISPAPDVDDKIEKLIAHHAVRAFAALGMQDYARFDVRYNTQTGKIFFLEANANPSLENSSCEPAVVSALAKGLTYQQFIHHIFEASRQRYGLSEH